MEAIRDNPDSVRVRLKIFQAIIKKADCNGLKTAILPPFNSMPLPFTNMVVFRRVQLRPLSEAGGRLSRIRRRNGNATADQKILLPGLFSCLVKDFTRPDPAVVPLTATLEDMVGAMNEARATKPAKKQNN